MLTCINLLNNQIENIPSSAIYALGNFDGVHIGHRALLNKIKALSKETGLPSAVFFFNDNSNTHFNKKEHFCITTKEEKLLLLRECGIDYAVNCDFEELCDKSADEFLILLKDTLHAENAVCGFNYRFGKKALGTAEYLQKNFDKPVYVIDAEKVNNQVVSSSLIRDYLINGNIEQVNKLLDTPFFLYSKVQKGFGLGNQLGFPTANQLFDEDKIIPKCGVYAVQVELDGKTFYGMANVGKHPSVNGLNTPICETNIFDFSSDIYGKIVKTSFLHFIREEKTFDTIEDLKKQLEIDKQMIQKIK